MHKVLKLSFLLSLVFFIYTIILPRAHAQDTLNTTEYAIPSGSNNATAITKGSDGNLWFTEGGSAGGTTPKIGRITPSGVITEYPLPSNNEPLAMGGITNGSDGNLWFTEYYPGSPGKVGRITLSGVITEFTVPIDSNELGPITSGSDGNLWFTGIDRIWKITPSGVITMFASPPLPIGPTFTDYMNGITTGDDGNIWFTNLNSEVGKITTSGIVTIFKTPSTISTPYGITKGLDGNIWFTDNTTNEIGRITLAGVITEFPLPVSNYKPTEITSGPDGNIWFTEKNCALSCTGRLGRITPSGIITEFPLPSSFINSLTSGPDGNIWFLDNGTNSIGRVNHSSITITPTNIPTPTPTPTTSPNSNVYVALGDSYSSGEGNPPFMKGTDIKSNRCHRSSEAWPFLLNTAIHESTTHTGLNYFTFRACSGATIQDFWESNQESNVGEPPQLSRINQHTGLITLTIGGNNIDFASVMAYCATRNSFFSSCESQYGKSVNQLLAKLAKPDIHDKNTLAYTYNEIKNRLKEVGSNAKVFVVGYPRVFPSSPPKSCHTGYIYQANFTQSDMKWLNSVGKTLDDNIKTAAGNTGFTYVDTFNAFNGHELCTSTPYINQAITWWRTSVRQRSFHPNTNGQCALERVLSSQLGLQLDQNTICKL